MVHVRVQHDVSPEPILGYVYGGQLGKQVNKLFICMGVQVLTVICIMYRTAIM